MFTRSTFRQLFVVFSIAALLALFAGMFGGQHDVAHAMDCEIDCYSGLPPVPEPEDPGDLDDNGDIDDDDRGDPPGPGCAPAWSAPTISTAVVLDPPYPITLGQDPDDRGVDVRGIIARAGVNRCVNGQPARITSLKVLNVNLAASAIAWINGDLARKYPGAHVKGAYPFTPQFNVTGQGQPLASLTFHLAPLDPGFYEATIEAVQSDGQRVTALARIPVYLLESTIIK